MTTKEQADQARTVSAKLVGLTEEAAIQMIKDAGLRARVRMRDGKSFMGTCDARGDRINLTIVKEVVTKAAVG